MPKLCPIVLAMVLAAGQTVEAAEADPQQPRKISAEDRKLAEQHFEAGRAAFERENWPVARIEFSAAYKLTDEHELLHNLSVTAERQGQLSAAVRYAQAFLIAGHACAQASPPTCQPLPQREADEAEGRLARLQAQLRDGQQAHDPTAQPELDADLARPAPHPTIGQPARELTTGQPLNVSTTRSSVNEPRKGRAGALSLIGVGGALLIVGIGCGAGALVTQNTINDGGSYFPNDYRALVDRGNALNGAAIAFDVAGAAVLASGVTWAIVQRIRQAKSP